MFDIFAQCSRKQKCSMRHAEPGYVKASKKASRALILNLQTLKKNAATIRQSLISRPDESEILRKAGHHSAQVVQESSYQPAPDTLLTSAISEVEDYRPPRPVDLDSSD